MTAKVVNGWALYFHPMMQTQIDALATKVEALRANEAADYRYKNDTKRLAAILKLITEDIPQDPSRDSYRQGSTLGKKYKHWYRAKFFQQYRLFFRYNLEAKIIVYVWVNDDATKRAYESSTDAYSVFAKMLAGGNPPDGWADLLEASRSSDSEVAIDRIKNIAALPEQDQAE